MRVSSSIAAFFNMNRFLNQISTRGDDESNLFLFFLGIKKRLSPSLCVFTHHVPVVGSGPPPIKLRKIVDLAPITITDQVKIAIKAVTACSFATKNLISMASFPDSHGDRG